MEVGMKVQAYKSQCIGIVIDSWTYAGKVVKVNKKSIVVEFESVEICHGSKLVDTKKYSGEYKFNFWKNRKDNGNALYKSECGICGIIEVK